MFHAFQFFSFGCGTFDFTQAHKSKVTARLFELDEFRCSFWVFNLSYTPAGDGNPATEHHFSPNVRHTQLILVQYSYTHKAGKEQENLLQGRAEPSSAPLPNPHQRGAPRGKCTVAPRRTPPLMIRQPFFPLLTLYHSSAQKKKKPSRQTASTCRRRWRRQQHQRNKKENPAPFDYSCTLEKRRSKTDSVRGKLVLVWFFASARTKASRFFPSPQLVHSSGGM